MFPGDSKLFQECGVPYGSDLLFLRRWAHILTPHIVRRAHVTFDSLTDVFDDGAPFPWLSDVPILL